MKIAFLSLFSGHINRGVESWTREISTHLKLRGHKILVLQGGEENQEVNYDIQTVKTNINWKLREGENYLSQALTVPYWFFLNLSFTIRSLVILIKFKPDIVFPSNGGIQTLLVSFFSKIYGWKCVVVGHAGIGANDKWNLLTRPDIFISPSKRGKIWAEKLYISKGIKIVSIPHGISLNKFNPKVKQAKVNLKHPIVLCVSSFDPFKRVDLAIKAVSGLNDVSLLVVGGDRSSGGLDILGNKLLGNRYKRVRVNSKDMPKYYALADLFTLPSTSSEAFGIVYLEALASNLPVVATDDDLRREIVGDAGILVDPTDIDTYSDAIKKTIDKSWGNIPRKQVEKFSWEKIVIKYESELNNII